MDLGVRTWGNSATGSSTLIVGTYETENEISRQLLESLPDGHPGVARQLG